jgi:transcriptional regulator PpsR
MDALVPRDAINPFRTPKDTLGDLDADVAAAVIAAAADVALVLDRDGVIRDLSYGGEGLSREEASGWIGRPWIDTVTSESRVKIEALLSDARARAAPRWRQVNHPSAGGADIPVRYSAVEIRENGRVVAIGRDLRALARLQQRLMDAQLAIERDYARLRQAETRYRLLFQVAAEAVLIVDTASGKVTDANPAAMSLLARGRKTLVGKPFIDLFDEANDNEVRAFLATVRAGGQPEAAQLRARGGGSEVSVTASLFRHENAMHMLVQIAAPQVRELAGVQNTRSALLQIVDSMPDGFVVTTLDGRILTANTSFLELAELAAEEQTLGEPINRWLGRSGVDLDVLLAKLLEHGFVRHFATVVRGEYGGTEEVELSAVAVRTGKQPCLGFTLRQVGGIARANMLKPQDVPRSAEELTQLVGRVSLRDLVRETTDMIERLYIEAALKMTGDNRASAAEMLGLSRQSLYVKLRRYGLGDLSQENGA